MIDSYNLGNVSVFLYIGCTCMTHNFLLPLYAVMQLQKCICQNCRKQQMVPEAMNRPQKRGSYCLGVSFPLKMILGFERWKLNGARSGEYEV